MLLKTSFLLPHLFRNVEFEFNSFISQHQIVTSKIFKTEMLLEFQDKTNVEITGF